MRNSTRMLLGALALTACGTEPVHIPLGPECEMLDPAECLLPWPSSRFLEEAGTDTGVEVVIPQSAMPVAATTDLHLDPAAWNRWDGFSAMTSMMARFEGPIDDELSRLPNWRDPGTSLLDDSPTLLLDVTGEAPVRIAHFAETEANVAGDTRTTLYLRPAARLEEDHTYVVAIRRLIAPDGTPVAADAPFAALRDGLATDSEAFEARRMDFETDVFDAMGTSVVRGELLLAWTFHTASGHTAWGDLVSMSTEAQRQVELGGLGCRVDPELPEGEPRSDVPNSVRQVRGHFDVPYFLSDPGTSETTVHAAPAGFGLDRDASDAPRSTGTRQFRFIAYIPTPTPGRPAHSMPIMVYGHGLWGSRDNVLDPGPDGDLTFFAADLAHRAQVIVVATDFIGLSYYDKANVGELLRERLDDFSTVVDHLLQGTVATLVLGQVFAEGCSGPAFLVEGVDVIDREPEHIVYDGDSLGGIVGPTLAALSPNMHRYAMGVGGISYSIMMPRSTHYGEIDAMLRVPLPRPVDRQLLMVMFAQHWDRFEGATFAPHVFVRDLPGQPTQVPHVLYQVGVNDRQTPQVAGEIAGRTLELPVLASCSAGPLPYGLTEQTSPTMPDGRGAWIAFDEGGLELPDGPRLPSRLPDSPEVHELVRRDPCAQQQVATFLQTGVIACPPAVCM